MQSDIKNSALDLNKAKNKERKYMKVFVRDNVSLHYLACLFLLICYY